MTWRGLPPYRNGIRVVRYWRDGVRIDVKGVGGFDMKDSSFADEVALSDAIERSGLLITVQQVRDAA